MDVLTIQAASARAAAIASALRSDLGPQQQHQNQRQQAQPIRAESPSPRIPAGGIDIVASRAAAASNLRAAAVKLDLDADVGLENASPGGFGGFASARGMKRSISEDQGNGQGQGTAQGGPRQGYGQGQQRTGWVFILQLPVCLILQISAPRSS